VLVKRIRAYLRNSPRGHEGSKFCPAGTALGFDLAHERMPVLLKSSDFDGWLANAGGELLKPAANDYLQAWLVSRRVNSSRAPGDDPTLIDRVAA
jgi:hypothetical protein